MSESQATAGEAMTEKTTVNEQDVEGCFAEFMALKEKREKLIRETAVVDSNIAALRHLLTDYINDVGVKKPAVSEKVPKAKSQPPQKKKLIRGERRTVTNREAVISVLKAAKAPLSAPELITATLAEFGAEALNRDSLKTTVRALRHDREVNFDEDAGTYSIVNAQDSSRAA